MKKKFDPMKAGQSARRRAHFESGGTVAMWRGRSAVFTDRKKKQAQEACWVQYEE
jgi:hypothetical protein